MEIHKEIQTAKFVAIVFYLSVTASVLAISYRDLHSIWAKGEWLFFLHF